MRVTMMCALSMAMACGYGGVTAPRQETQQQFEVRAADCHGRANGQSCVGAGDGECRWQEAACGESYPPICFEAKCLPVTENCEIVSSTGDHVPCSDVSTGPQQVEPSGGSGVPGSPP
ncbi:MAG: hypothetical protein IPJ65_36180 [Archangiaceae bacterium]|nr:hypothetical protein [Archangiaceae bacterium]